MIQPGRIHLLLLGLALALGGCKKDDGNPTPNKPTAPQSDIDRLRSLPYMGFVEDPEQEDTTGVVLHDPSRSYPGYNLYTVQSLAMAELID